MSLRIEWRSPIGDQQRQHLFAFREDGWARSACGLMKDPALVTEKPKELKCRVCLRFQQRSKSSGGI
jgi:hypothetical protein